MNAKNLLWPIVLGVAAIVAIVGLFLNFYTQTATTPVGDVSMSAGLFDSVEGAEVAALHTISLIAIIAGIVGLVGAGVIVALKAFANKDIKFDLITKVVALAVAVLAVIALVFLIIFMVKNSGTFFGTEISIAPAIGFFFVFAGLILGAISTFMAGRALK